MLQTDLPLTGADKSVNSFQWRAESSSASLSSASVAMATSAGPGQQPIQRLRSDSCDSASSAESSDGDSDEAPFAKKKCPNSRPAASVSQLTPAAARPTPKYNIWGSVLQEQTLSKDLGGWFGMNTKVESDRDVETYDYRNAKKNCTDDDGGTDEVDIDITDVSEELQPTSDEVNICDRETFGTSSTSTIDNGSSHSSAKDRLFTRKRTRDARAAGLAQTDTSVNKECARNRLSKRTYDKEKDRSHICVGVDAPATAIGEELARVLGEPEHMKDTFGNFDKS